MSEPLQEKLLLKEFDQRFQEKLLYIQRYHRQTDLIQIYLAITGGIAAVAFSPHTKGLLEAQTVIPRVHAEAAVFVFAIFAALVAEHFLFTIVDAWLMMFRHAQRMAELEKQLNQLCGLDVLTWDSRIAPSFHRLPKLYDVPARVDILSTATILLIMILVGVVLLLVIRLLSPAYATQFGFFMLALAALNGYQCWRISKHFTQPIERRDF